MIDRRSAIVAMGAMASAPAWSHAQSNKMGRAMKFKMTFSDHQMAATLDESPASRELFGLLPLDLKIEDYSTNEKIAYLPRKLTKYQDVPFGDGRPGDIAYYAPWGNLVFYHADYRYSRGLIRLGRFDLGFETLLTRGEFPLRIIPI
ncbi:hypothetical protein D3C80_369910 [compost metagenome]